MFKSINEEFEINMKGHVRHKETGTIFLPKNDYIRATFNNKPIYFNKNKEIYNVFKEEVIKHYQEKGFKFVHDYAPNFSDVLMVDNNGNVWNIKRGKKILLRNFGTHLGLSEKGKYIAIHRLVYMAFVNDPGTKCVLHKDGNKYNNNVENLYVA